MPLRRSVLERTPKVEKASHPLDEITKFQHPLVRGLVLELTIEVKSNSRSIVRRELDGIPVLWTEKCQDIATSLAEQY